MLTSIAFGCLWRLAGVNALGSFNLDVDIHADSTAPIPDSRTHLVSVGGSGPSRFGPNYVDASIGDIVRFKFLDANHTVTQSSLQRPCNPSGGFDSGYITSNNVGSEDKVDLLVTSTAPEWFYCRQSSPKPCGQGTIFAINPGEFWPVYTENTKGRPRQTTTDSCSTFQRTSTGKSSIESGAITSSTLDLTSTRSQTMIQYGNAMITGTAMSTGLPMAARSGLGCTGYGTTGGIATGGGTCSSNSTAPSYFRPSPTPFGSESFYPGAATRATWSATHRILLLTALLCCMF